MAEGAGSVTGVVEAPGPRDPGPIEAEIVRRRQELTTLVSQVRRRGRELTDVRLQVRRHAVGVAVTLLAVGAAAAGSIALGIWRARRRNSLTARGGRLREALGRMIDRPERVAVEPTATQRILGAAGSAAAAFLIKAALERASRIVAPRETPRELFTPRSAFSRRGREGDSESR